MKLTDGDTTSRAQDLFTLAESARESMRDDPFGNPVLAVSLAISRMLDAGALDMDDIAALVRHLRDQAFADRASRLAAYIGGTDPEVATTTIDTLARRLAVGNRADWGRFRDQVERIRFAAVFTAHPTFALPRAVYTDLAERMAGAPGRSFESHRPTKPTLAEEFEQVCVAITHGRNALDRLNMALLEFFRQRG
ncbi:MAG: phosphoenolpyruvate carboxylase, partial [Oxalobacteraceae bacterium]